MSIEVKIKQGYQCSKQVYKGRDVRGHRCVRRATAYSNGKRYCWQHDPVRIKKQNALDMEQWRTDRAKRQEDGRYAKHGRIFHGVLVTIAGGRRGGKSLAQRTLREFEEKDNA